ncbi:hypothetical protein [Paenibacillus typhae]|uniref:hypothetical protein n=1 Tax=Paenibacillus typhae TaxID=1174501 RepID=UPI001C8DC63D|nr:hypothetical protein [Paenibacillus typhae]MBY0010676.1 hypothetical protein [Paenibacillus typhae]
MNSRTAASRYRGPLFYVDVVQSQNRQEGSFHSAPGGTNASEFAKSGQEAKMRGTNASEFAESGREAEMRGTNASEIAKSPPFRP